MGFSEKLNTKKNKKVREFLKKAPAISSFHFTNGGHRFRPILEDVLESLRLEFNLDVDNALWQEHLKTVRSNGIRSKLPPLYAITQLLQ